MEQVSQAKKVKKLNKGRPEGKRSIKRSLANSVLKIGGRVFFILAASFVIHTSTLKLADIAVDRFKAGYAAIFELLPTPGAKSAVKSESGTRVSLTLEEAIDRVAREQRVPAVALAAMVEQESSNGLKLTSPVEQATYNRLLKSMPDIDDELRKKLAQSHGPAHVMGITALEICDMQWRELYDNYKGLTCAAKYLRIQIDKSSDPKIENRLWQAFRRYNGKGPAAEVHADRVFALMQKKIGNSLNKELS